MWSHSSHSQKTRSLNRILNAKAKELNVKAKEAAGDTTAGQIELLRGISAIPAIDKKTIKLTQCKRPGDTIKLMTATVFDPR